VYSNTGGQQSKATPIGAAAKFAVAGKTTSKKDLGAMARAYGHVYVARVAFGAKDAQTLRAFAEADAYPGTSLIIAYSPCIAHGYDLAHGLEQQKLAVDSGYWPLYRFDPRRREAGGRPFVLDSTAPKADLTAFARNETRFRLVEQQDPDRFGELMTRGRAEIRRQFEIMTELAAAPAAASPPAEPGAVTVPAAASEPEPGERSP
jgi:pyruvate-ferredoxin/flavodoxin oxidoreductase